MVEHRRIVGEDLCYLTIEYCVKQPPKGEYSKVSICFE